MCDACREMLADLPEGVLKALQDHSAELDASLTKFYAAVGDKMIHCEPKDDLTAEQTTEMNKEISEISKMILGGILLGFQINKLAMNNRPEEEIMCIQAMTQGMHDGAKFGHALRYVTQNKAH